MCHTALLHWNLQLSSTVSFLSSILDPSSSLMVQICTPSKTLLCCYLISLCAETLTWAFTSSWHCNNHLEQVPGVMVVAPHPVLQLFPRYCLLAQAFCLTGFSCPDMNCFFFGFQIFIYKAHRCKSPSSEEKLLTGQESTISVLQISEALCCRATSYMSSMAHHAVALPFQCPRISWTETPLSSERKVRSTDGFHTCVLEPPSLVPLTHKCCTGKKGRELVSLSMNR